MKDQNIKLKGKKKEAQIIGFNYFKNFRITRTEKKFFFQVISPLDIVNYRYYNFTITRYNQFASRYQYPIGNDQISKVEENFSDIEEISRLIISTGREERIHFCEISFFFIKYQSVKFHGYLYLPRNPVELSYSLHARFSYFN